MKKKKTNDLRLYIQGRSHDHTVTWLYVLILSALENSPFNTNRNKTGLELTDFLTGPERVDVTW